MIDINDEISYLIDQKGSDFTFKLGEDIIKTPINNSSIYLSYRYLLNDNSDFSFNNVEFLKTSSEKYLNKNDYQIYFDKVNTLCSIDYNKFLEDTLNYKLIQEPNKELKSILCSIFNVSSIKNEQIPPIVEIRLYTNKKNNRAPRVFGLLGTMNIIYILVYDPFHKIYNKTAPK